MIRIALNSIKNNRGTSLLFVVAFILVLTLCPIMFINLDKSEAKVDQDIEKYGRGTYDILVRPVDSQNDVEKKLGLVQDNYSHYENDGLTISDWNRIKEIESIEIAAPIASVGYMTGMNKSYSLPFPKVSSKYTIKYFTSDGIDEYELEESQTLFYHRDSQGNTEFLGDSIDVQNSNQIGLPPTFLLPTTYHFVVAIDPISESKLTGINFEPLLQDTSPIFNIFGVTENTASINIMKSETTITSLKALITKQPLDIEQLEYTKHNNKVALLNDFFDLPQRLEIFEYLSKNALEEEEQEQLSVDFSSRLQPFEYDPFIVSDDGEIIDDSSMYYSNIADALQYYTLSNINYEIKENDILGVKKAGSENGVPIYRNIHKEGKKLNEIEGDMLPLK